MKHKDTTHFQGASFRANRHSVGQLDKNASVRMIKGVKYMTNRVQVTEARGRVMPEILSINEDFPALWAPMTAI